MIPFAEPDYMTLAQALLYAGAENVVGTLWRVDDSGSASFAEEFYGPLARLGLTGALAAAQRRSPLPLW